MNTIISRFVLLSLVFAMLAAGCASFDYHTMSAGEIYAVGDDYYNRGRYAKAKEAFEKLKEMHPFSVRVTTAELRIAECLYNTRDYAEAQVALEEFLVRHPTNEDVPRAIYYLGMTHYDQMLTIDRTLQYTKEANRQFYRLVNQYGSDEYAQKAKPLLADTRERLAKREHYVAKFYWKQREYYSALGRYQIVIRDYPDTAFYEKSLWYAARCQYKLDDLPEAKRYLTMLISGYANGKYTERAKELLAEIQGKEAL